MDTNLLFNLNKNELKYSQHKTNNLITKNYKQNKKTLHRINFIPKYFNKFKIQFIQVKMTIKQILCK